MRRAEIGHHHNIAGAYLLRYAQEASWREDNRRVPNGGQVSRVAGLAMQSKPSVDLVGMAKTRGPITMEASGKWILYINKRHVD
jgi:hypothetical protein